MRWAFLSPILRVSTKYGRAWSTFLEDGPDCHDLSVRDDCNTCSSTECFDHSYTNDTGLDRETFFTGSERFKVKEIEVFETTD
jgi:hypothetical protein